MDITNGRCDGSKEYEEDDVLSSSNREICIYYFKCQLTHGAEKSCPCIYEGSCEEDVQYAIKQGQEMIMKQCEYEAPGVTQI